MITVRCTSLRGGTIDLQECEPVVSTIQWVLYQQQLEESAGMAPVEFCPGGGSDWCAAIGWRAASAGSGRREPKGERRW